MFRMNDVVPVALLAAAAGLGGLAVSHAGQPELRSSKFFEVDVGAKRIVGPGKHVPGTLRLDLASVSVDQPQYWPNEAVRLKVLMPGRPGSKFKGAIQKRDANRQDLEGTLDAQGVAVLTIMDGTKGRLEIGEYRVDARSEDGRATGHATFSIVEGALGAVSLAHEFKQVTSVEELEKAPGAWFMGNAAGAGKRWGNGLSFKNELRVANQPYDGDVQCVSRCMLPGCNGVQAGAPRTYKAVKGRIEGTLDVGGHSGPFQIEFVTPKGSLRHQFEGSSHVERDFVLASGGVTWVHRAGLAPYEKTVPVSGRQIFVEKVRGPDDAFEIDSVVARNGELTVRASRDVEAPALVVWAPKANGEFEPRPQALGATLKAGQDVVAKIATPYSLVTVGGFVGGQFKEGWALAFVPAELSLGLEAPSAAAPARPIQVRLWAKDAAGAGVAVSGVLEVFDNRVASRSPLSGLASGIGDSMRNASSAVARWQDRTGLDERAERLKAERTAREHRETAKDEPKKLAPAKPAPSMKTVAVAGLARGRGGPAQAAGSGGPGEEEEKQELIREGERKVVFCDVVRTDASGQAVVDVTLPPQIGRVSLRFVAVRGLDHVATQRGLDVSKKASVEASLPRTFVPGASLRIPLAVANALEGTVTLSASGAGVAGKPSFAVPPGSKEVALSWTPTESGKVLLELADARGKALDKRELPVQSVAAQRVTFSRLVIAGKDPIPVGPEETAIAYAGPGALLKGVVANLVTTMESWFGHAEARSAQVAVRAVLLSAISRKILDDEGFAPSLAAGLDKDSRDLEQAFFDPKTNLIRPYPGLPANPLWSAWVSRNLHAAVRALEADPALKASQAQALARVASLASRLDAALGLQGFDLAAQGYDAQGRAVIPVEIDGKVAYRVLTDDAVQRFLAGKLLPSLDARQEDLELAFAKAYDAFRFLKAYQRVGALQYLTEAATALWLAGDRASFEPLFARITRGMILAQEPGMVQGPATLGGVYSSPMAMVRFLELLVAMGGQKGPAGAPSVKAAKGPRPAAFGEAIAGGAGTSVTAPAGSVVRVDRAGIVPLLGGTQGAPLGKAELAPTKLAPAAEAVLTVTLAEDQDPLEHYAIVAAPSNTAVKQTEDVLSDYRGQLIYGQQSLGAAKVQVLAVPFRGSRTMRLLLEGAFEGTSPGAVAIRHLENPAVTATTPLPAVTVGR